MPAPVFVASYSSTNTEWGTATTPKTLSITTQAGDVVVVYAGMENTGDLLSTPTGNGIVFSPQQSITDVDSPNICSAYIWTGRDSAGGTSWTLSCSSDNTFGRIWGMTCVVFRAAGEIGDTEKAFSVSDAAPTMDLTTQANSALVVFDGDWNAFDGTSRAWRTVNSITPTSGNGLELNYFKSGSNYTYYGAYYNDTGAAGTKTVGLTTPVQRYSIVAVEVKAPLSAPVAWLKG